MLFMFVDCIVIDRVIISSELKNLDKVESFIDKVCCLKDVSDDIYGNILMSCTEAVSNAIIHGNHCNNLLNVEVLICETGSSLVFTIIDQGVGFDFHSLPDPTSPENIEKENGRGIFLIKNLCDEMVIDEPGNIIHITFNL
jgi:serine/threonine-protein kinase RsbW